MSALPKQVRAQIDRANQIADEIQKAQNGQAPAGDDGQPPAGDPPPDGQTPQGGAPDGQQPPQGGAQPQEWEQRYRVLQGKYNAEVPRLQRQVNEQSELVRDMRQQLTATQNLLASLSQQQRGTPPPDGQQPQGQQPARLVKDEEVKEFGADLIDVMRRVVREENASLMPEIDRRLAPVAQRADQATQAAQQAGQRVARNDQQAVLELLTEKVPNWQTLNADVQFLEWLDQVDPFAGVQRGAMLDQAYKAHDGPRVVAFFTGYLKEHAAVSPPNSQQPQAGQQPQQGQNPAAQQQQPTQRRLDDFVAPGTAKSGAANAPDGSGKRVWSRAEIGKFYADRSAGRIRDPKEAAKIEADIFAAQREGRIR